MDVRELRAKLNGNCSQSNMKPVNHISSICTKDIFHEKFLKIATFDTNKQIHRFFTASKSQISKETCRPPIGWATCSVQRSGCWKPFTLSRTCLTHLVLWFLVKPGNFEYERSCPCLIVLASTWAWNPWSIDCQYHCTKVTDFQTSSRTTNCARSVNVNGSAML